MDTILTNDVTGEPQGDWLPFDATSMEQLTLRNNSTHLIVKSEKVKIPQSTNLGRSHWKKITENKTDSSENDSNSSAHQLHMPCIILLFAIMILHVFGIITICTTYQGPAQRTSNLPIYNNLKSYGTF